jgi:Na+-translocating ferredoxin:NAD+ oxidoreductase RnfG subunit
MNSGLKSGLVLLVLGLICGTLLAFVNSFTAPRIFEIEEAAQYDAIKQFYFDPESPNYENESLASLFDLEKVELGGDDVESIFYLRDKNTDDIEALGYVVFGKGYGDNPVKMLIVVDKNLNVIGTQTISHSETPSIGGKILNENDYGITSFLENTTYDAVAGSTRTEEAINECFQIVADRISDDLGGN